MAVATQHNTLVFSFPEVHPDASLRVTFHRTLRVPDETTYGLPPSLGTFEVRDADDASEVLMPMWQSEAAWIDFTAPHRYPFMLKIGVGGINAITGDPYTAEPDYKAEDYLETSTQPWLDGFRVDDSTVRQFVAMPLGRGYSAAEQLTGTDTGIIAFSVVPLKAEVWKQRRRYSPDLVINACAPPAAEGMGLGAGGTITQSIATPVEPHENWCRADRSEWNVRLVNSESWQALTGRPPHHQPLTIDDYLEYGFPWFEWYDDSLARQGESQFGSLQTVKQIADEKGEQVLPDNPSFTPPGPIIVGGS